MLHLFFFFASPVNVRKLSPISSLGENSLAKEVGIEAAINGMNKILANGQFCNGADCITDLGLCICGQNRTLGPEEDKCSLRD